MKIAVLLFGHLRDFENCAPSLKSNLIDRYDCDVFMHTWDETDHKSKTWHGDNRFDIKKVDETVIEQVKAYYNPKGLIVEHQEKYKKERIIQSPYSEDFKMSSAVPYYMFYTMNKVNQLRLDYEKKNGISYDYVIVTRPDVRLKKPFEIERYVKQIEVLGFDMNSCRFFGASEPQWFNELGCTITNSANDIFFFAKPNVVDKYIKANVGLTEEEIEKYLINGVSVYTAKEIRNGIMPIPLIYLMDRDWDFSAVRIHNKPKSKINLVFCDFQFSLFKIIPVRGEAAVPFSFSCLLPSARHRLNKDVFSFNLCNGRQYGDHQFSAVTGAVNTVLDANQVNAVILHKL